MDNEALDSIVQAFDAVIIGEADEGYENKENLPNYGVNRPRPIRHTPHQTPATSNGYRLGKRVELTDKDLDFVIYEDETAHDIPPPRRQYYGSNLPALPEVNNGQTFKYAMPHELRHQYARHMWEAHLRGDEARMDIIAYNYYDPVPIRERVTGHYHWNIGSAALDVWLWVQDRGYDRKWTPAQRTGFQAFLRWMKRTLERAAAAFCRSRLLFVVLDALSSHNIPIEFDRLGLPNLLIEKDSKATVFFTPAGEDKNVIHRRDFRDDEQEWIDERWPEYWAPGEEPVVKPVFAGDDLIAL